MARHGVLVTSGLALLVASMVGACAAESASDVTEEERLDVADSDSLVQVQPLEVTEPESASELPADVQDQRALAVATAGCLNGLLSAGQVYIPARAWHGIVLGHGVSQGDLDMDDLELISIHEIRYADFTTQAFETAATLDPKWESLSELWDRGSRVAKKAWNQGSDSLESINATWEFADKLTARCKVPYSDASAEAQALGVPLAEWIRENSDGLLALDLIDQPLG